MRISDWSSDVCSSDLFALTSPGQPIHLRFAGIPMGHEFSPLVLALLQVGGHPSKTAADVIEQEIGRASCRERVCQYVYISVVAVSLKKKKLETTIRYYYTTKRKNFWSYHRY